MRFDIRYGLRFAYDEPVWESQNEIRVRPRHTARQQVVSHRLVTRPSARVLSFTDYWGTTVEHVGIRTRHDALEIISEAVVDTVDPISGTGTGADHAGADVDLSEFLTTSAHTRASAAVVDAALAATGSYVGVEDRARAVSDTVGQLLTYTPGVTEIGTEPGELLVGGAGVCQDYAHLSLAMLRSLGIASRYVSGYLFAADETTLDDGGGPAQVQVQTHAWIEVLVPERGWLGLDPTNGTDVGARHIEIGHGRDYDDVPPVVGVYAGAATPDVDAEVVITHLDAIEHDHRRAVDQSRPGLQAGSEWIGAQQQQQQ